MNITQIIKENTPAILLQPIQQKWLEVLLSQIQLLSDEFEEYKTAKLYELNFTGQAISLERLLNNKFDNTQRRITIGKPIIEEPYFYYDNNTSGYDDEFHFLFRDGLTNPSLENWFLLPQSNTAQTKFDVLIPQTLYNQLQNNNQLLQLIQLINKYKCVSTVPNIVAF